MQEFYDYDYGFRKERWATNRQGTLWLEMPVALLWQQRQVAFEAGLLPGLFLRSREKSEVFRSNSFQTTEVRADSRGWWSRPDDVRRGYAGLFAGIQSRPGPRNLSIGLRANWLPGEQKPSDDPLNPVSSARHLRLDIGLRWMPLAPGKNKKAK